MGGFLNWLRQPSTINGIGIIAGVVVAALQQALTSGTPVTGALLGAFAWGIVNVAIDDNTASNAARAAVLDAVARLPPGVLLGDVQKLLSALSAHFAPRSAPVVPAALRE